MLKLHRFTWLCCVFMCLSFLLTYPVIAQEDGPVTAPLQHSLQDSLFPPPPPAGLAGLSVGPSQFMAGDVAVGLILAESNNIREASTEDWTSAQIEAVTQQVQAALSWWETHLPLANLHFTLDVRVVETDYEPVTHGLSDEHVWISNVLENLQYQEGSTYTQGNHFDRAYAAAYDLREHYGTDWATLIFMANSAQNSSGRFNDNRFAYAYINGPFMVVTSDAGSYGTNQIAPVIAHEMGHIFGALDQYSQARVACDQRSGYLNAPTSNSQYDNCPTSFPSIMISPISAYNNGDIDPSALAQIGYYDSDANDIIDPLDTTVELTLDPVPPTFDGARPRFSGSVRDIGLPSRASYLATTTINHIVRVEYRANDSDWVPIMPDDGTYNTASETFSFEAPLYDGNHHIELRAVNNVGKTSPIQSTSVEISGIGTEPEYAIYTPDFSNTTDITLTLTAPADTPDVQISTDPSFHSAVWQDYQPVVNVQLNAQSDGPHQVYVRFRDPYGYTSPVCNQQITLDTQPPAGQITLQRGTNIRAFLRAEDQLSGVTEVELQINDQENLIQFYTDDAAPQFDQDAATWFPYRSEIELPQNTMSVRVRFRDAAGNVSDFIEATTHIYLPLVSTSS